MSTTCYNTYSSYRTYCDAPGARPLAGDPTDIPGVYDLVWADRDGLVSTMSENLNERDALREHFERKEVLQTVADVGHFCRYLSLICNVAQPLNESLSPTRLPAHGDHFSREPTTASLRYHKGRFSSRRYNATSGPPSPIGSGRPSPPTSASSSPAATFASLRTPGQTPPPDTKPAPQRQESAYYTTIYGGPPILKKLKNASLMSEEEIYELPEYQRVFAIQKRQARLRCSAPAVAHPVPLFEFHRPPLTTARKSLLLAALMGKLGKSEKSASAREQECFDDDKLGRRDAFTAGLWNP
ncbi:uncharacterized protein PHACADRAFT_211254 [Phanerochaete carnosa HHB-10118-sp]|uniref:Uncharacterized protein n=1 Tax=Phanerochaete carnosa (strain HHB-10118-sp) TaxID=650164 RepID=K5W361_PHACS|nr:uncharacterized protein PHACADRAFT_211254 [Phanerochaete carnosa HHB-10118-sp]EKM53580.1 hypothetical protein PHACADRAFT_211254 [Phanerochaete carnosa HHB-10118-sp]